MLLCCVQCLVFLRWLSLWDDCVLNEIIMCLLNMMDYVCISLWYLVLGLKDALFFFPLVDLKDNLKIHVVYCRETHKTDISNSLYGVSESHLKPELLFDRRKFHQELEPHRVWPASQASVLKTASDTDSTAIFTERCVYVLTLRGNYFYWKRKIRRKRRREARKKGKKKGRKEKRKKGRKGEKENEVENNSPDTL